MTESERPTFDALLVVSFGGPEREEDVIPFLEHVLAGKQVPEARIQEVAERYSHFEGKSPINEQTRRLVKAVDEELRARGMQMPVYWGCLHAEPFLADTLRRMRDDGVQHAVAFVTSAYSSAASCRKYLDAIEGARQEVGPDAPEVQKLRAFYNHPGFIEPMAERIQEALRAVPEPRRSAVRVAFTAHSIPVAMSEASPYVEQLEEACRLVAERVGTDRWQLVYQSRSGRPGDPWLEPDVLDHLEALSDIGVKDVVVAPIGFVSDHMEVLWDLDVEAQRLCDELGLPMYRAATVGTHPEFVSMIRELIQERTGAIQKRRALGTHGPAKDQCPPDCCRYAVLAAAGAPDDADAPAEDEGPPPGSGLAGGAVSS
jgi:protoporphyrin/coproporphyrin ferrochelatase